MILVPKLEHGRDPWPAITACLLLALSSGQMSSADSIPSVLRPAIKHLQEQFDESDTKCSWVTQVMCFGALRPGRFHPLARDERGLGQYREALGELLDIVGVAAPEFSERSPETSAASILHAYAELYRHGLGVAVRRMFQDALQIALANISVTGPDPVSWAKNQVENRIRNGKHRFGTWIKNAVDIQPASSSLTDVDIEEVIHWRTWRAPRFIHMHPAGNTPYDDGTAWVRENEEYTKRLLDGLSDRFTEFVTIGLDELAGNAHLQLAKIGYQYANLSAKQNRDLGDAEGVVVNVERSESAEREDPVGIPTAFVSYSWDSVEHKDWVLRLAERLCQEGGVRVCLDRWHLGPGGDRTHFMEKSIRSADFVLVVCTPLYAAKANRRVGGVGYEAMIITGHLAQRITQDKFIPILRAGSWDDSSVPIWMGSKIGVDFRGSPYDEKEFELLLRALHRDSLKPPPIGPKPVFSPVGAGILDNAVDTVMARTREHIAKLPPVAYAFYERKGSDGNRVEVFVRPQDATGETFTVEVSTGETFNGVEVEVGQRYLAFDLALRQNGYTRMQTFDGFARPTFRLP
jgi:hypothetical protein